MTVGILIGGKDERQRGSFGLGVMNGGNSEFLLNSGVTGERRSGVKHNNELWGRAAG
jgi:hypothetical protein